MPVERNEDVLYNAPGGPGGEGAGNGEVPSDSSTLLDIFHLFPERRGFNYISIKLPGVTKNRDFLNRLLHTNSFLSFILIKK